MPKVYVTRKIPENGIKLLREKGYEVDVSDKDGVLTREELLSALGRKPYDAVISLLTDKIDAGVFAAVPTAKVFANYAVGYDNINLVDAEAAGVIITNTPSELTSNSVAEHAIALLAAVGRRVVEADQFVRDGKYQGWDPMLFVTPDLCNDTIGIIGLGRIGQRLARHAVAGFNMKMAYFDICRNQELEQELKATYYSSVEELIKVSDYVVLCVNLTDETKHLINAQRLALFQPHAILVNISRGAVIDEVALVEALRQKQLAGAGLDVFEFEPKLSAGLIELSNVVLTPHIASATKETREDMARLAAENIIAVLEDQVPPNIVGRSENKR